LLGRAAEHDWIATKEGGQDARCEADVDPGHRLAHAVDVERPAAHPAEFLGDEYQLYAELLAADRADELLGENVLLVELEELFIREVCPREILERIENQAKGFRVEGAAVGHGVDSLFRRRKYCATSRSRR
jgi:hypothetical protein